LISRIGVVLWSTLGRGCEVALGKADTKKEERSAGLSKESAGEASNLMRRPIHLVRKPERNHIRLRGVGFE
jgi:hypothetical protein